MKRKLFLSGTTIIGLVLVLWLVRGFTLAGLPVVTTLSEAYEQLPQAITIMDRHGKFLDTQGSVIRTIPEELKLSQDLQNSLLIAQDCLGLLVGQEGCQKKLASKTAPLLRLAYQQVTPGTWRYKIWTWKMARQLTAFSPADLLALYANSLQFSPKIFGARTASWRFFGKSPKDLDLNESLLLAALSERPELDPALNANELQDQMITTYKLLASRGNYQADRVSTIKMPQLDTRAWERAATASPISNLAIDQAKADMANHDRNLEQGITITTTIDLTLQEAAERILNEAIANQDIAMGSIVVLDLNTHQPLVMAEAKRGGSGSIGHQIRNSYQPGSAIKPFLYLAALLDNYTAASIINNSSTDNDLLAKLGNDDSKGPLEAPLRLSLTANMPNSSINLLKELEADNVTALYKKLGFVSFAAQSQSTPEDLLGLRELSFLDLVNGYAVLAQGGLYFPLNSYISVTKGEQILESSQSNSQMATNAIHSYIISQMLHDELNVPPYNSEAHFFEAFAAKAGASYDGQNSYFIGFNGAIVVAVHVQPIVNEAELITGRVNGHSFAGPIWSKMVHQLPENYLGVPIAKPYGVNCVAVDPMSGGRIENPKNGYFSCFKNGTEPQDDAPNKIVPIPPLNLD